MHSYINSPTPCTCTHTHTHPHTRTHTHEVIELDSRRQSTDSMSSNPLYMPNTDASIKYEGENEYAYIDQKDIRILARNPIVGVGEDESAIPPDHSDQDNVAYSSTTH